LFAEDLVRVVVRVGNCQDNWWSCLGCH
jgi:hypothetical protein